MTLSTGPSTNQSPYLIPSDPRVSFVSLLSAGDYVPGATIPGGKPWRFAGIADGLGAYDNCDNTITVLVNHEIGATDGIPRETGAPRGAYVDKLIIDKSSLKVLSAEELGKQLYVYDETSKSYQLKPDVLGRLCSADLPTQSALYDAKTGLGTQTRIYFNGEEVGAEGRAFAWIVDDKNEGSVYELPALGNLSFENVVASPNTGARTVVLSLDDVTGGQVYAYVGEKRAAGNEIEP